MLLLFGLSLNQSSVVSGVNLSFADPIALLLLIGAAIRRALWLPRTPLLFFLLVSVVSISASLLTPLWLPGGLPVRTILTNFAKLITCFGFFTLGVHMATTGQASRLLRYFALGAALIAGLSLVNLMAPGIPGSELLFYGDYRFRGLMNDPNYFSVLAVCALAVAWRDEGLNRLVRAMSCSLLSLAVLMSGSKTGAVVLILWSMFALLRWIGWGQKRRFSVSRALSVLVIVLIGAAAMVALLNSAVASRIAEAMEPIPALNRLTPLLTDFETAVNQGGSGREESWEAGFVLIELSPLIGVGMGGYLQVAESVTGAAFLAHNTYLQIAAEWGVPLAGAFLLWTAAMLVAKPIKKPWNTWYAWQSGREILFVMLAGSLAISLNNARLFWLSLGIVAGMVWMARSARGGQRSIPHGA